MDCVPAQRREGSISSGVVYLAYCRCCCRTDYHRAAYLLWFKRKSKEKKRQKTTQKKKMISENLRIFRSQKNPSPITANPPKEKAKETLSFFLRYPLARLPRPPAPPDPFWNEETIGKLTSSSWSKYKEKILSLALPTWSSPAILWICK